MRCHRSILAGLAFTLAIGAGAAGTASAASITTYSTRAAYLAAIGPNYTQETFDGFASGTALTTQVGGLVLSSPNSGQAGALPVQAFASSGAVSAPNLLAGGYLPGSPDLAQAIVIDFLADATAFGGYVSPLTPNAAMVSLKVDFRDQTSQTLQVSTGNGSNAAFLGLTSDSGILRVTYTSVKTNSGQSGFRNFGADDLIWVTTDASPPTCTATKSIINDVLGFDGTSTDAAPFDTGVASVALVNAVNVSLACDTPFPAACGSAPAPAPSATWRVQPSLPGVDGSGTVIATDASGNACTFDVTFTAFPGGAADSLVVCRDTGVVLAVSNPLSADPGQIICSSTPPGPFEPPYPAGYEPSPAGDPSACTVFTIKSPIEGPTLMVLKKDGVFEPRLRLLFSRFDGVSFPPFADITESVDPIETIIPDPTRVPGTGTWSQVKVACGLQAELCNGLDDDGDGLIDEGFPIDGPAIDCDADGYPQCATTSATATDCSGVTVPLIPGAPADCNDQISSINSGAVETCNGLDDNCDGVADEGSPEGGLACDIPGYIGACAAGLTSCAEGPLVCQQVNFPAEETCDEVDNDCDGLVDEDNPPGGEPCSLPDFAGVCAAGAYSCATGSRVCTQVVFPSDEACNGLDDDCDGDTDEDLAPLNCGVGACAVAVPACVEGVPQTCIPGTPSEEACNGVDDDCDGATDEDLGASTCGIGACAVTVDNCVGGEAQTCAPGTPSEEACNGLDDDCDGAADEDLGTISCGTGACEVTVPACADGLPQVCDPLAPSDEACNGVDDDCDGETDESLGTSTCGIGACAATVDNCVGGQPQTCTPGAPSAEVCNGLDDDCDGAADEAYVWSGYFSPVKDDGSGIYQAGRTIPLKFRLATCSGATVTNATATLEIIPYLARIVGSTEVSFPNLRASIGSTYQYDAKGNQYFFNLGTKGLVAGTSYIVRTRVSDGSVHDVVISLK